jgi:hypothetical protein
MHAIDKLPSRVKRSVFQLLRTKLFKINAMPPAITAKVAKARIGSGRP